MEWQTSDFREFPKYFGDVAPSEFSPYNKGVRTSAKYIAFGFGNANSIGYIPTDFNTGISEKAAQGRRAEYGAKTYTTDVIGKCLIESKSDDTTTEPFLNNLQFNPFNDFQVASVHNTGILNIWNLPQAYSRITDINEPAISICNLSTNATCLSFHPSISNVIAVGSNDAIYVCNINSGEIVYTLSGLSAAVTALEWLPNGSLIRAVTEDGKLISFDPRSNPSANDVVVGDVKCTPEGIFHLSKVNPNGNVLIVIGSTSFREPIVYVWDITNMEKPVSKYAFDHKNCYSFGKYDPICNLFYLSFRTTADLIVYECLPNGTLDKLVIYHGVKDTFVGFDTLPKNGIKKREINKIIKLAKNRVQLLPHHKGGKIIYNKLITKTPPQPVGDADVYFEQKAEDTPLDLSTIAQLVDVDFEEKEQRKATVYLHVTGKESQGSEDRYYNISPSRTVNIPLGQNIKVNSKYCIFPSQVTGGGGLGVIPSDSDHTGRQKQGEIRCHSDQISTFDITQSNSNLYPSDSVFVATGAADAKVYISEIPSNLFDGSDKKNPNACNSSVTIQQIQELQHDGKVSFVQFHPRIPNVLITADKGIGSSNLRIWDVSKGIELLPSWGLADAPIMDIVFEPVFGLLAAVSSQDKLIRIVDIKNKRVLFSFESLESKRDVKLTWIRDSTSENPYYTRLMTLGFGKGSVRRFSIWDIEDIVKGFYEGTNEYINLNTNNDEKEEKTEITQIEPVMSCIMTVSNSIPISNYDADSNLVFLSSVGDLKIRVYELNHKTSTINEMNSAFTSKKEILGVGYQLKQFVDVKNVEMVKAYKFTNQDISPISFFIPRKRKDYFQDDLYSLTLDYLSSIITFEEFNQWLNDGNINSLPEIVSKGKDGVNYIDLTPSDMGKLSEAPPEEDSEYTRRRKSQQERMEAEKLKSQPKSTEQAMEAFSRMVADAPTANRWDAVNIGTEVADDEWDD